MVDNATERAGQVWMRARRQTGGYLALRRPSLVIAALMTFSATGCHPERARARGAHALMHPRREHQRHLSQPSEPA